MHFSKLLVFLLVTPLLGACSKGPSESDVEALVTAQYAQAQSMMDDAMAQAGDDEMAKAMGSMMTGMMPTLEDVSDVNCDSIEGDNTYMCTANIQQTVAGESKSEKASFKVYRVNDEWVLDS